MKTVIIALSLLMSTSCFSINLFYNHNSDPDNPGCTYYYTSTRMIPPTPSSADNPSHNSPKTKRKHAKDILKQQLRDNIKQKPKKD